MNNLSTIFSLNILSVIYFDNYDYKSQIYFKYVHDQIYNHDHGNDYIYEYYPFKDHESNSIHFREWSRTRWSSFVIFYQ